MRGVTRACGPQGHTVRVCARACTYSYSMRACEPWQVHRAEPDRSPSAAATAPKNQDGAITQTTHTHTQTHTHARAHHTYSAKRNPDPSTPTPSNNAS